MGDKNMFKKSKLFEREGFYIVLFVCLCIVAVTGVYISKSKAPHKVVINTKTTPDNVRNPDPLLTDQNGVDKTQVMPTSKSLGKTTKEVARETKKVKVKSKATHKTKFHKADANFKIIYPVKGEIVKKYDNNDLQFSKSLKIWETHEGIDIACEIGTEVKAAATGKVCDIQTKVDSVSENSKDGYGASITIDHGDGYRTVYCNLNIDSITLKKGDKIKMGEVIGKVGDTSKREQTAVEGSHIHFELLKKSGNDYITINPQTYLK